jgi:hypothetical protein
MGGSNALTHSNLAMSLLTGWQSPAVATIIHKIKAQSQNRYPKPNLPQAPLFANKPLLLDMQKNVSRPHFWRLKGPAF